MKDITCAKHAKAALKYKKKNQNSHGILRYDEKRKQDLGKIYMKFKIYTRYFGCAMKSKN